MIRYRIEDRIVEYKAVHQIHEENPELITHVTLNGESALWSAFDVETEYADFIKLLEENGWPYEVFPD